MRKTIVAGAALAALTITTATTGPSVESGEAVAAAPVIAAAPLNTSGTVTLTATGGSATGTLYGPVTRPAAGRSLGSGVRVRSNPITGTVRAHLRRGERITVYCVTPVDLRDGHPWGRVGKRLSNGRVISGWTRFDLATWYGAAPRCG